MKNIKKRVAAAGLALGLALATSTVAAPVAHASTPIGSGTVDVFGAEVAGCTGTCLTAEGAGVVVPSTLSDNEVLTVAHVVDAIAPGNTIYIYDPIDQVTQFGYVQKKDDANDLAVLWIYGSYNPATNHFTRSSYTFAPSYVGPYNPGNTAQVKSYGDSNTNWSPPLAPYPYFATATGTIVNRNYPVLHCGGRTTYNEIQTTFMTHPGDSGGPLYDIDGRDYPYGDYYTVVGINDCSDTAAPFNNSYAIQIGWAMYDMLPYS